jgi:hypothetical protein
MARASTDGQGAIRSFAEHELDELTAGIDRIHELGEELASLPVDQRAASIRKVLQWIDADVKPHMTWEESWLFPQIDARAGTPWATRIVRFDHRQIAAQAERLQAHCAHGSHFPPHDTELLVADLSRLEALLRANVEREERFLLPLLEGEAE